MELSRAIRYTSLFAFILSAELVIYSITTHNLVALFGWVTASIAQITILAGEHTIMHLEKRLIVYRALSSELEKRING